MLLALKFHRYKKIKKNKKKCPHHTQHFDPTTSDDGIYKYACGVLSLALFMFEFNDAIKEGDGERVYRVWKYLVLIFRESGPGTSTRWRL